MAVGVTTQYIPNGHPKLPIGSEEVNLIAVPLKPGRQDDFIWILFADQIELK